ncbi:hypothetical protein FRC10_003456 [Ceratobasidium sp. 414]|nr:hypothetical protein FRC10_003456 [Ceratobasidium sp. 414]
MDSNHSDGAGSYDITGGTTGRNSRRHTPIAETAASRSTHGFIEELPRRITPQPRTAAQLTVEQIEHERSEPQPNPPELPKIGLEDTNQLLVKIGSTLENVNRVLIGTQQSMARVRQPILVRK